MMVWFRHIVCLALFTPVMSEGVRVKYRRFSGGTLSAVTSSTTATTSTVCCHICTTNPACSTVRYNESSYVCELGSSTLLISHSGPQIVYASGSSIYELVKTTMTWNNANNNCKGKGGQLVKVGTLKEHNQLMTWLQSFGHNQDPSSGFGPWIGLNDLSNEGSFTWADGSAIGDFSKWGDSQPDDNDGNEDCVSVLYAESAWNDYPCEESLWSVCEYN